MNSISDRLMKQYARVSSSKLSGRSDVFEPTVIRNDDIETSQRALLVEWINNVVPNVNLPPKASSEEFRACLIDGTVLLKILNRLRPAEEAGGSNQPTASSSENVRKFLAWMDELGIPKFELSDLEKGSMKTVVDCLSKLRTQFVQVGDNFCPTSPTSGREERLKVFPESKFQQALRSPVMSEPSAALMHHVGHKFHEVFQLKQGNYSDLSAAKISEMMRSNSLDNAPTQSLLSVVNGILDESIERKSEEIPHRVACLLRKVVQEIERRISTQAEHLRTQNNLFKAREEKYQSRIRVLEALASGSGDEQGIVKDQLEQIKIEKSKMEEQKKLEEEHVVQLTKEKEQSELEISALKQELEKAKQTHELQRLQIETEAKGVKAGLEDRVKELELHLEDSRNKINVLEAYSKSKSVTFNKKEHIFKSFVEFQFGSLQELRLCSNSIKHDILKVHKSYSEEFDHLGTKLKALVDATENYHSVLAENRRMFNELQELKGNIRVYCRIRPFLPGLAETRTTIEYIGEHGELVIVNPSKPGKEGRRMFKFNKVFGQDSTQAEVFSDTQPLIRSVLDGYSVCIFAYGQTGSGKTYTMSGPNGASEEDWGVNYRALNDLFRISQSRSGSFVYEVGVQMVEIYNEQVRDLLLNDGSQKKLGILSNAQQNGIAVPDASMHPVTSTSDVLELIDIGLKNRAVGATAMNERSSRSHSVVSIHVRGKDFQTGSVMHSNLHLVDLAGSERVDRSEATGDRLREAQHINKSLSALGDVIFSLAQKSPHVPYRNSKLTQLLQSSLGGQAKTLMFVQLNPDINSYSETISTLKFAERVSGVELGAARSSKEGRDVKELMDQVATLKDAIAKRDDEIEQLQLLKDLKTVYPSSVRIGNSSAGNDSTGRSTQRTKKPAGKRSLGSDTASYQENSSEYSDVHSEADSQQSKLSAGDTGQDMQLADDETLGFGDGDCEDRLSDISDGGLSAGAELDGSKDGGTKLSRQLRKTKVASAIRMLQTQAQSASRTVLKGATSIKNPGSSSSGKHPARRWQ